MELIEASDSPGSDCIVVIKRDRVTLLRPFVASNCLAATARDPVVSLLFASARLRLLAIHGMPITTVDDNETMGRNNHPR